ncbi:MAG: CHASE2 domain-containing protein [Cellvibrionaceae bacterium]
MWIHIRHIASVFIVSIFALLAAYYQWTLPIDRWLFDRSIGLQSVEKPSDILIVAIDDQSIQNLGRWPWPRQYHANLIKILNDANAKAIAFDVIFPDKDSFNPQQDQAFVNAVKNTPSVVLPMALEQIQFGGQILERLPFDELARAAKKLGHVHIEQDEDGVCRSVFLREGVSSAYWPHLTLAILESIDELPTMLSGVRSSESSNSESTSNTSMLIARDYYNLISFVGKAGSFPMVSYIDVLNGALPKSIFKDKIIFVGRVANGTNDILVTPVGTMPGVELNANIFHSLRNNLLITPMSPIKQTAFTGFAALLLVALLSLTSPRFFLITTITSVFLLPTISFLILISTRQWYAPGSLICSILIFYPFWNWQRLEKMLQYLKVALIKLEPSLQKSKIEGASKIHYFEKSLDYLHSIQLIQSWSIYDAEKKVVSSSKSMQSTLLDSRIKTDKGHPAHIEKSNLEDNLFSVQSFDFINANKKYNAAISWSGIDRTLFDLVVNELEVVSKKNEEDNPYRVEVVDKTLLELKRANKVAEYNQNLIDSSIKNLPEAVIMTNLFGHILQTNIQAKQLWTSDSSLENFIQYTTIFNKVSGFDWEKKLSSLAFYSQSFSVELKHSESQRIFICQGQKMEIDRHNPGIMLFSFNEITALRASEQARLETLHFLSHDLRAPMNSVLALVQHAKHQDTFDTTLLDKIEHHVHTNLAYSQQFLQLAKAEEVQTKDFYLCDIIEIIDNAIEEVFPTALAKDITLVKKYLDLSLPDGQQLDILGDGQLLERMFINLLGNAIKFSPSGEEITIDISVDFDDTANQNDDAAKMLTVSISDNGIGIPQEKLPLLFNRFSSSSKNNSQGVGLGLYFVKVVCERHGGEVTVTSEPSLGSKFNVSLPQLN